MTFFVVGPISKNGYLTENAQNGPGKRSMTCSKPREKTLLNHLKRTRDCKGMRMWLTL
jgi:hypothetical protein